MLDTGADQELKLRVNGRVKFFGKPGTFRRRRALMITREASLDEQEDEDE